METNIENTKQIIAYRITSYMEITKTSKEELAKKSGVSETTIWKLINKFSNPRLSTLVKLENAMTRKLTLS